MNVSGIRPYSGFYNVNSISATHNDVTALEPKEAKQEELKVERSEESVAAARSKQTFGAYDYAEQYRPTEDFEVNSKDSDLRSLDVQKAISDMRKDQAIQQYQVFVGEKNGAEEKAVRGAEDFSL
jgi:hypothetical protein